MKTKQMAGNTGVKTESMNVERDGESFAQAHVETTREKKRRTVSKNSPCMGVPHDRCP